MESKILSILFSCLSFFCYSQKEGNIWYFGDEAGLDFNSGVAVSVIGPLNAIEGCSTIADPTTGQLLFYTDGVTVWDRNHNPMPGSITTPLNGHPSSTQSSVIVPSPGSNKQFYVFTTGAEAMSSMCYSIVDLNLGLRELKTSSL